ncbi:MAG: hypothetical protein RJQ10_15175 [Haliea sp.]|uniref:hypothetical protein n=1 Tax=Haliea sp. TaxID=1932666 RepID=UPI0032EAE3C0
MQHDTHSHDLNQKERARQEIDRQVEAFLNSGGRISVVDTRAQHQPSVQGYAWREYEEAIGLLN